MALRGWEAVIAGALALGFGPACRATDTSPPPASARPREPAAQASPPPAPSSTPAPAPAALTVDVSLTALTLDGATIAPVPAAEARREGFDGALKRSGQADLYIVPLANAVSALPASPARSRARVTMDGALPYRIATEVLFTLGQNEVTEFDLRIAGGGQPSVTFDPPRVGGTPRSPEELRGLHVAALLVAGGVFLKASGGNVAPGCEGVGPGPAVPRPSPRAAVDLASVVACAKKLKGADPAERQVTVAANAEIPMGEVMALVVALRGTDAEPLFPDVSFAIAR